MDDIEPDILSVEETAEGNLTMSFNESVSRGLLLKKLQEFMSNRAINDSALVGLLLAYVLLIFTGGVGNGLVCLAVARKPQMRTARNVFIINLAISDLILCLFTMPFSLVEIVLKFWPLGELTCKLVGGLQATSIFVSTISITSIALDRYKVILHPTQQENCKPSNAIASLSLIWTASLCMAGPMFWFRTVDHVEVGLPWLDYVDYCLESWPIEHGGGYYSIFTMVIQYVLPIFIVCVAYARICRKLSYRMSIKTTKLQEKQERDKKRVRKTNTLLIAISLIFCVSWLPLNILNVVASFYFPFEEDSFRIIFACCHMAGMSSACSNPLLYGWLNDNFRKEFQEILSTCFSPLLMDKGSANKRRSAKSCGYSPKGSALRVENKRKMLETSTASFPVTTTTDDTASTTPSTSQRLRVDTKSNLLESSTTDDKNNVDTTTTTTTSALTTSSSSQRLRFETKSNLLECSATDDKNDVTTMPTPSTSQREAVTTAIVLTPPPSPSVTNHSATDVQVINTSTKARTEEQYQTSPTTTRSPTSNEGCAQVVVV